MTSIEMIHSVAEALLTQRRAFAEQLAEEPNDRTTEEFMILEVKVGEDHFGETVWEEVFRHHSSGVVGSYAGLYHAGQIARLTKVRREFPNHDAGTIVKTFVKEVPDGFEGLMQFARGGNR